MNQVFAVERLALLMRADLVARYRTVLIIMGTVTVLVLVQGMLTANSLTPLKNIFGPWFFGMLFVWGPIAASLSFRELHDKSSNEAYLLLPASALEKALARLLLVTVVLAVFVVVFLYLLGWLNALLNLVVFGQSVPMFSLADFARPRLWSTVLVVQSVYFLGAAWFRKSHFVKTTFAFVLIALALGLVGSGLFWLFFGADTLRSFAAATHRDVYAANEGLFRLLEWLGPVLYFYVLPVFCWWVAWLRVKETQVSYGV